MGEPSRGNALLPAAEYIGGQEATGGTETSKYPEEKKSTEIPGVAASETGPAQTGARAGVSAPVLLGGATEGRIPRPLLQTSHLGERPGKAGGTG